MSSLKQGDLLDRCTLEIRASDGPGLGTGVLVGPSRVVTCCHVVGDRERVEVFEGPASERLTGATVGRRGDPEGADDLALLELDAPLPGRGAIRFADWTRDDRFGTVGFPDGGKDHVSGDVQGLSRHHGWLQFDATSSRKIVPGFSGGAVWVQAKYAAVGLVTRRDLDGVAYAVTAQQIRAFWPELRDATRCAGYLRRVGRKLRSPDVRAAIADADPEGSWRLAAGQGAEPLAETLCLETIPDDLTAGLCRAYCRLLDDRQTETAEQVFGVLMESLPAALLSQWHIPLPEGSANEVQLELLSRVLAEFALAAAEDGAADFQKLPERGDSDVPRASHRVPGPGELGADPEGEEAARELARELELRLALDVGSTPESRKEAERYLAFLATHRHTGDDRRLLDRSELRDLEHASRPAQGDLIVRVLNKRLARRTSAGRHLYLVADKRDQGLVEGLHRLLPDLKIVKLEAPPEQFEETEMLLDSLKRIFHRRNPERPNR